MIMMIILACSVFAKKSKHTKQLKPGFVVTPFSRTVTLAPNSSANVLIIAQNQTTVTQTITNVVPQIPSDSGITGTVTANQCGVLSPGESCAALVRLQSSSKPSSGNLNISICSFNGTFCSRIIRPFNFTNSQPLAIFVTPTTPTIASGTTQQFTAIGLFANATIQDVTTSANWTSSNTAIATISNGSGTQGLATGVTAGTSSISATLDGVTGSSALTVTGATLTSITVTPTNPSIANGNSQQFTATGIYSDNTDQDLTSQVTWSSSNTAIATISNTSGSNGVATSKSAGTTTITATFGAVSGTTNLTVTAATLTSISVTPSNPTATIETTEQFTATGIYSDNTVKDLTNDVTWSTQSALIAIISNHTGSKGKALAVGVGSTSVNATFGGVTGSTTLNVSSATLTGIDVAPINETMPSGSLQQYTATGTYNNGRNDDITTAVTWQSSNSNIATISNASGSQGLAKGVQAGTAGISASLDGIVGSTNLTISSPTLVSIAVTPTTPTIANGTDQQFTATGTYSDASTEDITSAATWSSGTPSVAVISNASGSEGLATSVSVGSSVITAGLNGISGNTTLTVSAATLVSIAVTPANTSMPVATNEQYTATGTYSDASTLNITKEVTWNSSNTSRATISNAVASKGLVTGVSAGTTTISATDSGITGNTGLTVINISIGDSLQGGKVACLDGGLNNLITANTNNSNGLPWGGNGTTTNAQSNINGEANTTRIVNVLGAGITYAAGICEAYEIDSAGNTPCIGGNTCYNDWFLPSINQLTCLRGNRNQIGGFTRNGYWSSTESTSQPRTNASFITFENSGFPPATANKTESYPVRCVRLINGSD
jgi:hypothetical protein